MLRFLVALLVVLCPLIARAEAPAVAPAVATAEVPAVAFDGDMDVDDSVALAYLAQAHKQGRIHLVSATVTNDGVAYPGHGIRYARCILARAGILDEVEVADGSATGTHVTPALLRSTIDLVLSQVFADCTEPETPNPHDAAHVLAKMAERYPGLLVIVTGPGSNLAQALQYAGPNTAQRIGRVVTMGGALHVPAGLCCGEPAQDGTQEENVWNDSAAYATILQQLEGKVTLTAVDATNDVPVTFAAVAQLAAHATTPEAQTALQIMSHPIIRYGIATGQFYWWDPLAAVSALVPAVVQTESVRLTVVQGGLADGRTQEDPNGSLTAVAVSADLPAFLAELIGTLNGG